MQWKGICSKTPCDCLVVLLWCSVSRLVRTKEANLNHVPRPTFVVVQLYSEASGMSVVSLLVGQCVVCHDAFWYLSVTVCIYFFFIWQSAWTQGAPERLVNSTNVDVWVFFSSVSLAPALWICTWRWRHS